MTSRERPGDGAPHVIARRIVSHDVVRERSSAQRFARDR
jgi:hypothetical protein